MANSPPTAGAVVSNTNPALFPGPETLTGQHVILERVTQRHIPDLYENVASHDYTWTWLSDGPFSTASDFVHWLTPHLETEDDLALYAVLMRSGPSKGKTVGLVSLFGAQPADRVIELGVLFGRRLQRTTAATELVSLVGSLLFDKLNYRRVEWKCHSLNLASKKAAERYGFVYEGTLRQARIVRGRNRDTCCYSMIDSEWAMCSKVFESWLEAGNFDEQGRQRRRMEEVRESLR